MGFQRSKGVLGVATVATEEPTQTIIPSAVNPIAGRGPEGVDRRLARELARGPAFASHRNDVPIRRRRRGRGARLRGDDDGREPALERHELRRRPILSVTYSIANVARDGTSAGFESVDWRLGAAVGKTIGAVAAPFVVARPFGGGTDFALAGGHGADHYRYHAGIGSAADRSTASWSSRSSANAARRSDSATRSKGGEGRASLGSPWGLC